jgi:hypothetical protein
MEQFMTYKRRIPCAPSDFMRRLRLGFPATFHAPNEMGRGSARVADGSAALEGGLAVERKDYEPAILIFGIRANSRNCRCARSDEDKKIPLSLR